MTRVIYKERIPSTDPRLGRHILHDSESRRYVFDTTGLEISSVAHPRHIPILDQGQVGSCTGNAGIGNLGSDPMYADGQVLGKYTLNEPGALHLYSDAEDIDGDGPYPPNDNGSTGLSIAKALKNAGVISGYQHTFTVADALKALTVTPILIGVNWYNDGFNPATDGRIPITGALAGGHELVVREYDATNLRVWADNSWGAWGVEGRGYFTLADFTTLLGRGGDVTILLPLSTPAPTPTPVPPTPPTPPTPDDPDVILAQVAIPWAARRHCCKNIPMWRATQDWLVSKGYTAS